MLIPNSEKLLYWFPGIPLLLLSSNPLLSDFEKELLIELRNFEITDFPNCSFCLSMNNSYCTLTWT